MVYLRNFERAARTGLPIAGATVTIYEAILTGAHGPAVSFTDHDGNFGPSTTTNSDGMWEATDLPDGVYYDVQIEFNSQFKWYFGRTMHQVERLDDDQTPAHNRNLLLNGNMDSWSRWIRAGSVPLALGGSAEGADYWLSLLSGGDSGTVTRALAAGINSLYVSSISYTRVGGNLTYAEFLVNTKYLALRSRVVTFSVAVHQATNARVYAFIQDGISQTNSAVHTGTGSWAVLTVTRTIDAAASTLVVGIQTDTPGAGTYAIQVTNAVLDYGADTPVYTINPSDAGLTEANLDRFLGTHTLNDAVAAPSADLGYVSEVLDWFARQLRLVIGGADWFTAPGNSLSSLTTLAGTKVAKAGDTMSGNLTVLMAGPVIDATAYNNSHIRAMTSDLSAPTIALLRSGLSAATLYELSNRPHFIGADGVGGELISKGTDGAGSGVDSDLLDGQEGSFYQARGNHTGTQLAATISDLAAAVLGMAAGSASFATNAGALDGIDSTGFATAGHVHAAGNAETLDGIDSTGFLKIAQGGGNQTITFTSGSIVVGQNALGAGDGMKINGSLNVTGAKTRLATGTDGDEGYFHALETPSPYFEDFGRARLDNARVTVQIPEDYANFVDCNDYHVYLTPEDPAILYVSERHPDYFVVELLSGDLGARFSWRLLARQVDLLDIARLGGPVGSA